MSRKSSGYLLIGVGLILAIVSLVVMFVIVPGMKKLPTDVDTTRHYEGTMPILLDVSTGAPVILTNLNVRIDRHVKVEEVDGDLALVSENQKLYQVGDPNAEDEALKEDKLLKEVTKYYVLDRKTMEGQKDAPDAWKDKIDVPREGVSITWPLDSEKTTYDGWSDDYQHTVKLVFNKEEEHARTKLDTYLFVSEGSEPISSEGIKLLGLPPSLTKAQLIPAISAASDASATEEELADPARTQRKAKVIAVVGRLPDDVTLDYTYTFEGQYWIEPQTGVLIDTQKHELRMVKLSEEMLVALEDALVGLLPEETQGVLGEDETLNTTFRQEMRQGAISDETRAALAESISDEDLTKWEEANLGGMASLAALEVPVYDLTYQATDESVNDAKSDAEDAKSKLNLFGTTLPVIGNILGIVLIALGAFFVVRRT